MAENSRTLTERERADLEHSVNIRALENLGGELYATETNRLGVELHNEIPTTDLIEAAFLMEIDGNRPIFYMNEDSTLFIETRLVINNLIS